MLSYPVLWRDLKFSFSLRKNIFPKILWQNLASTENAYYFLEPKEK